MMSPEALLRLRELSRSKEFQDAFAEFVAEESRIRIERVRAAIRSGNAQQAAIAEAEISLLEDLPSLMKSHGDKYRPRT